MVNDHGGTATVDDFGITTSAGDLLFGAAVEDPADTFTYTAETLLVAAGEYDLAELEVAGYEPSDWTCSNGDGGAFDDGSVTVAVGDPTGDLLDHQRRPAGRADHREGRGQRRRRHRDGR